MSAIKTYDFIQLLDKFIQASVTGRRLQRNGKRLRKGTIENYRYLRKLLSDFCNAKEFDLRIKCSARLTIREHNQEKKYWKKFYQEFSNYLYNDLGCFDNYVGSNIQMLRTFFNYLNIDLGLPVGNFHKQFYVRKEEIPIVVLTPEQLNFLIYNKEFENSLTDRLKRTKDIFVFGSTVALRVSDLMSLRPNNVEVIGEHTYLKTLSRKTHSFTRIKIPEYAVEIIKKYRRKQKTLLPLLSLFNLNKNIRLLMEAAGWTYSCTKTRSRQGINREISNQYDSKGNYRFCDLVSSHTMRRTAITTMLSLGMPEHLVRKISGHAANSKEFFRYVALSQLYVDGATEKMFENLRMKTLIPLQEIA